MYVYLCKSHGSFKSSDSPIVAQRTKEAIEEGKSEKIEREKVNGYLRSIRPVDLYYLGFLSLT